jgi:cysteine desulfurase
MIYLDYQATTPVAPDVAKAMEPWFEDKFANPQSPSRWGHEAQAAVEVARKQVEKALGLKGGTVAFTGSATEALNWALKGTAENARAKGITGRNRIVTVATEHAAVLDTCEWLAEQGFDLTVLPVQPDGRLDLDLLARELDGRVLLVAIMMVNNEIGVRQPLTAISEMVHKVGAIMLSDAVQAFGRVELCNGPDLVAISAH